jgi:hypothetical protein
MMMAGESQSGVQCVEVEALLAEALDGTLQGATLVAFEAHQKSCAACRAMFAESSAGMSWLKELDDAEPPRNLVHNILAQTIGALPSEHAVPKPRGEGWLEKLKGRLAPVFAPVATPRFAMSFGMAFFSITMLLGIAGFHFADIRHLDLSSKGITRTYYETQARVMRYYENMRLVYEIESRVRDLRRAATRDNNQDNKQQPQQQQQAPAANPDPKNPSKSDNRLPDRSPHTYSRDNGEPQLATAVRSAAVSSAVLKGHAFRRAAEALYFTERASAREAESATPQARRVRRTA